MSVTAVPLQPVKRSYLVWLWLAIAALVAGAFLLARQGDFYRATPSGLKYHVFTAGAAERPSDSDVAVINYVGRLPSGDVFDRSQQPTPMPVAASDPARGREGVIPGFSEALKMMGKGSRYRFVIPAHLAYGAKSPPGIPANSPLTFDVEMLTFVSQEQYQRIMMQQQMMQGMGGPGGPGGPGAPGDGPGGAPADPGEQVVPTPGK